MASYHCNYFIKIHCYYSYRDQFMLLAEEIANEKAEKEIRGRAQQQVSHECSIRVY